MLHINYDFTMKRSSNDSSTESGYLNQKPANIMLTPQDLAEDLG